MKTRYDGYVFLVLVPHQDVRIKLRKYCDSLIKTGLKGLYNFPFVVPLVSLTEKLNKDELKKTAIHLRKITEEKKINTVNISNIQFPAGTENMELLGPRLDLNIENLLTNGIQKLKNNFSPLIIGSFLIPGPSQFLSDSVSKDLEKIPFEHLSFRAAAVANMHWQPVQKNGETIFIWKIGNLCWLPRNLLDY